MQNVKYYCRQRIEALTDNQNHYTYFSPTWRKCLNFVYLGNCENLLTKNFLMLFTSLHTIQSLPVHKNASHCSRMSKKISKDFMI